MSSNPFGAFLLAVFLLVSSVMLLNLLIAVLSGVYEESNTVAMEEHALAMAETARRYESQTNEAAQTWHLPPPLNLLAALLTNVKLSPCTVPVTSTPAEVVVIFSALSW